MTAARRIVSLLDHGASVTAWIAYGRAGRESPLEPQEPPQTVADVLPFVIGQHDRSAVLVMPLGLPDGLSLAIAREAHRWRVGFRMVLFTGSYTATAESTVPLYDFMLSTRDGREMPAVLDQALAADAPQRQDKDVIDRQIVRLVRDEACFRHLRPTVEPCRLRGSQKARAP